MPTFHSPRNPDFKLWSSRLPKAIAFVDGVYSTDDPDEIKALRRHVKTGALTEGDHSGEFARGGFIPSSTIVPTAILDAGAVITPHQAEQIRDGGGAPEDAQTVEGADQAPAGTPPSNRELRVRCAELGIQVPERAGKRALLDAIEIAEQQDAEGEDGPNDPDGS